MTLPDGFEVPSPGWERRLLQRWVDDKARDWLRKASRFEGRTRGKEAGTAFARAAAVYIARVRRCAAIMAEPVTEAEWEAGS